MGLCHVLHTPLPTVLRMPLAEAVAWYEACGRFQKPKES